MDRGVVGRRTRGLCASGSDTQPGTAILGVELAEHEIDQDLDVPRVGRRSFDEFSDFTY